MLSYSFRQGRLPCRCQIFHSSAHHPSLSDLYFPATEVLQIHCQGSTVSTSGQRPTKVQEKAPHCALNRLNKILLAPSACYWATGKKEIKVLSSKNIIYGFINVVGWRNISRKGEWDTESAALHLHGGGASRRHSGYTEWAQNGQEVCALQMAPSVQNFS